MIQNNNQVIGINTNLMSQNTTCQDLSELIQVEQPSNSENRQNSSEDLLNKNFENQNVNNNNLEEKLLISVPSETQKDSEEIKDGVDLLWRDIDVSLKSKKNPKKLIQKSTGFAKKGEILAIMGPSGSGKTTLLSVITKRIDQSSTKVSGNMYMNGKEYTQKQFSKKAAFIQQNDLLMETLTVKECIEFSAKLRSKNKNKEEINKLVKNIIKTLQLEKCQNIKVGGVWLKGISGGERKRTCIGVELVSDPQLLVLDEPTSGLDSFTSWIVVNQLKQLAKNLQKTVILTIHSPNSDILQLFDRILMMKKGQIVYQGGARQELMNYLEVLDEKLNKNSNPLDFTMSLLQKDNDLTKFNHDYYTLMMEKAVIQEYAAIQESQKQLNNDQNYVQIAKNNDKKQNKSSFCWEFRVLTQRCWKNYVRDPQILIAKIFQIIFFAFFLDTLWWQTADINRYKSSANESMADLFNNSFLPYIQNVSGGVFIYATSPISCLMATVTLTFPIERCIFLKEHNSGSYGTGSYFLSKLFIDIPYLLLFPFLFAFAVYFGMDLREDGIYVSIILLFATTIVGNGMGLLNGSLFKTVQAAAIMTATWLLPLMILGGYFSNLSTMSSFVRGLSYLSPFTYVFEAAMINQFEDQKYIDIQKQFGFDIGMWNCIYILFGMGIILHILAYLSLRLQGKHLAA